MLKSGYSSSDKQLETVSQWKGLKFVKCKYMFATCNEYIYMSMQTTIP